MRYVHYGSYFKKSKTKLKIATSAIIFGTHSCGIEACSFKHCVLKTHILTNDHVFTFKSRTMPIIAHELKSERLNSNF